MSTPNRDAVIAAIEAVMPADTALTREYGRVGIAPDVGDIADAVMGLLTAPAVDTAAAKVIADALCGGGEELTSVHLTHPDVADRVAAALAAEGLLAAPRVDTAAEPPGIAAVRAELIRALEYHRWCWDCGTTDHDCRSLIGPCCPDCRHRDAGNLALGRVLAAPGADTDGEATRLIEHLVSAFGPDVDDDSDPACYQLAAVRAARGWLSGQPWTPAAPGADTAVPALPEDVAAAAERVRAGMRTQEAEVLGTFGLRLGAPTPRPDHGDLLTLLHHLGIADDTPQDGACANTRTVWAATTYCTREPGHPVTRDDTHRDRWGTQWWPRTTDDN